MEYLSSSSGIQNILIQPSQQLIIKNYQPDIKSILSFCNSFYRVIKKFRSIKNRILVIH